MKKLFLLICLALTAMCANAQKGEMAVGGNIGIAPTLNNSGSGTNFGIGAKYQYNIVDPVRLEAGIEYWVKSKGTSMLDAYVNGHYLINCSKSNNARVYPIAGIGIANVKYSYSYTGTYHGDSDDPEYDDDYEGDWGWGMRRREPSRSSDEDYTVSGSSSSTKLFVNLGAGVQYDVTSNISVDFELKYQFMSHWSRMPITIGVVYKF